MELRSIIKDGVETGVVVHNGREYSALGSVVSETHAVGYLKKVGANYVITRWDGVELGGAYITSSWETPNSYVSDRMYQIKAQIGDARYTGRCAGEGMIWKGKRTR